MSTKTFDIVVIGAGNAGLSASAYLLLQRSDLKIAIVDPSDKHYYQPAWTLVGGGAFDIKKTEKNQKDFIPENATWIKESCSTFQPEQNQVTLSNGDILEYKVLIVAPGMQLDWFKIKGLEGNVGKNGICSNYTYQTAPYTFEMAKTIKKGDRIIFHNPNTPIKCGGAPQKIMYLLSDYWSKKGILKDISVNYFSGGCVIFGVKRYADTLNKVLIRYGIKTHYTHNLVEIKPEEKLAIFDVYKDGVVTHQITTNYDMIHIVPPQSVPDFIKKSPLAMLDSNTGTNPCFGNVNIPNNYFGWIDINKHTMQHVRYENIFACGDATSSPNAKTGAAIRKQVPVMCQNILQYLKTKTLTDLSYNGYGSCPLVTGYGKLVLAEFDYNNEPQETFPIDQSQESWLMYQMKSKLLPWLYWNRILKGKSQG